MKIAFFGTPPFTTQFLDTLTDAGYAPSLIVTNPDRPVGRGMVLTSPEPKVWGDTHHINVIQPEKLDAAFIEKLTQDDWDLFIVVAYGKIMPQALLDIPRLGSINVHYSLLPKYRGATPVESAILAGDTMTGISIQQMQLKLDSGPVYTKSEIAIAPDNTTPTLRQKLNDEAVRLLIPTIQGIEYGSLIPAEQDHAAATFTTKIRKEDGKLDLTDDHIINHRKYRAYAGSIGTYFMAQKDDKDIRMKIKTAHFDNGQFLIDEVIPENGKPIRFPEGL